MHSSVIFTFRCNLQGQRTKNKPDKNHEAMDFCLSLSWKCRFSQNVNRAGVQSKTNKCCGFRFDLTGKGLSGSRFKKLGVVPKKLYRNTLKPEGRMKFGHPANLVDTGKKSRSHLCPFRAPFQGTKSERGL